MRPPSGTTSRQPIHRRLRAAVLAAAVGVLCAAPVALASGCTSAAGEPADYLIRINELRRANGLAPLAVDHTLAGLAQGHTSEMARVDDLFHTHDLTAGAPEGWRSLSENVGTGPGTDAVWEAFLDSPPHLENLLHPSITHVGVGVVEADGTQWTTHRFMTAR